MLIIANKTVFMTYWWSSLIKQDVTGLSVSDKDCDRRQMIIEPSVTLFKGFQDNFQPGFIVIHGSWMNEKSISFISK